MPKPTFFNLKEEKRQTLIEALKFEFSRVPLHDACITNILQAAGIPRGSFYQYFEDKEDAYYYVLNEHAETLHRAFISCLKESSGDLFQAMEMMFHHIWIQSENQQKRDYFKLLILNLNYKLEQSLTEHINEDTLRRRNHDISEFLDLERLNVTGEKQLFQIFQIIKAVTIQCLTISYYKDESTEQALTNYREALNLLRQGLER